MCKCPLTFALACDQLVLSHPAVNRYQLQAEFHAYLFDLEVFISGRPKCIFFPLKMLVEL